MRNSPVDGPVDIKVQIAAELRAVQVAAARCAQNDLNGLPDIIQPPDDFAGGLGPVARIRRLFSWGQYCPRAGTLILKAFKKLSGSGGWSFRHQTTYCPWHGHSL